MSQSMASADTARITGACLQQRHNTLDTLVQDPWLPYCSLRMSSLNRKAVMSIPFLFFVHA